MALVIEDGSGVTDANSYIDVAEAQDYASARGVTLPAEVEPLLVKAMDYFAQYRGQWQGQVANHAQPLQWPRYNVYLDGVEIPSDTIPTLIKDAQAQLAVEASKADLMPSSDGRYVTRQTVGPITREFAKPEQYNGQEPAPTFPKVEALLQPLTVSALGRSFAGLRSVRV